MRYIVPYRLAVLSVLLAWFYGSEWMPARKAVRDVVASSIALSGYTVEAFSYRGSPAIRVEGKIHYYSAECTYLDLLVMVVPFLWVFGLRRRANVLRLAIAALVIFGANVLRCWGAVYLDVLGVDRFYAHDLPDHVIWWPTVLVVALLALRRDLRNHWEPGFKTGVVEKKMGVRASETYSA